MNAGSNSREDFSERKTEGLSSDATAEESVSPELNEDQALALLQRADITSETLSSLARNLTRNAGGLTSRKVALALTVHPRTPRHISIPLLRRMFTFDLMQVSLTPAVAADIKRAAEEQILRAIESLSAGEKISLARRASGRVAAKLLLDTDPRVITPALDNPRLVENSVVQALMTPDATEPLFAITSGHGKWPQRRDVQIALLRSAHTPMDQAREFAKNFPANFLAEILPASRTPELAPGLETHDGSIPDE